MTTSLTQRREFLKQAGLVGSLGSAAMMAGLPESAMAFGGGSARIVGDAVAPARTEEAPKYHIKFAVCGMSHDHINGMIGAVQRGGGELVAAWGGEEDKLAAFRKRYPDVKIVALSTHSDKRYVLRMLRAGASAYLVKAAAGQELVRAIIAASQGRHYLSSEITGLVLEECFNPDPASPSATSAILGPREREVLQLVAEGKSSKEIGVRLSISVRTVESHRQSLMSKLNLNNIADLVKYAIREGLTSAEP